MKGLLATVLFSGAVLCGTTANTNAAPVAPAPIQVDAAVEKVHGYHRSCRGGPGWFHRHTRRDRTVRCRTRWYRAPGITLYFGHRDRRGRAHRHHRRHHDSHYHRWRHR